jgi:sugar phosphate isomerase/epimerase
VFSLEFIGVFGMPPVQLARMAAELGYQHFTTVLEPFASRQLDFPTFSLREDKAMRRELVKVMGDVGVSLSLGEGIAIAENLDVRQAYAADLEIMRELGIPRINVVTLDPDLPRTFDQLAILTEMAGDLEIETLIEFVPIFTIPDIPTALEAIAQVGRPDCRMTLDTMHFFRSGAQISDFDDLDSQLIGYIQLCDVHMPPVIPDYMEEAVAERMIPGEGDLPLRKLMAALPRDRVVGLEIPMRSLAMLGSDPGNG